MNELEKRLMMVESIQIRQLVDLKLILHGLEHGVPSSQLRKFVLANIPENENAMLAALADHQPDHAATLREILKGVDVNL